MRLCFSNYRTHFYLSLYTYTSSTQTRIRKQEKEWDKVREWVCVCVREREIERESIHHFFLSAYIALRVRWISERPHRVWSRALATFPNARTARWTISPRSTSDCPSPTLSGRWTSTSGSNRSNGVEIYWANNCSEFFKGCYYAHIISSALVLNKCEKEISHKWASLQTDFLPSAALCTFFFVKKKNSLSSFVFVPPLLRSQTLRRVKKTKKIKREKTVGGSTTRCCRRLIKKWSRFRCL